MKRYAKPVTPTAPPSSGKEYCTIDCGNMACRVNFRHAQKGEKLLFRAYIDTITCRGYARP